MSGFLTLGCTAVQLFIKAVLLAQGGQGAFGAPDPLDADPLDLMASQSHLLDSTQAARLERGNSSNCQQLEIVPPPSMQELDVSCIVCVHGQMCVNR